MATREVKYEKGEAGYNAMVDDFAEMFDWDTEDSPTGTPYTDFRKNCGDDIFVSLRVKKPSTESKYATVIALVKKGDHIIQSEESQEESYFAYSYGSGFFVLCSAFSALPNTSSGRCLAGVSTCRNIVTGESGWMAFLSRGNGNSSDYSYYQALSKGTMSAESVKWSITTSAKIGGAVSLHEPTTGYVSDKIMLLTAIPDTYNACLTPVIFNGTPYTRLGTILVPAT